MVALRAVAASLAVLATTALAFAQGAAAAAGQGESTQGAMVTFERVVPAGKPRQSQSQLSRLISLCVERGEVPSPFLTPGYFRATYRAIVNVPVRDRYRFRIEGRGSVKLHWNGTAALDGRLLPGKPIDTDKSVRLKKGANELLLEFESPAMGDGQLRLFWAPPDCGFEPIPPQLLSWAADDPELVAGERLSHGQQLFAERRCARCHEFEAHRLGESAFGALDLAGPDLRAVGGRLDSRWMAAWLLQPRSFRPDAAMPQFGLAEPEADDLATWLGGLGAPLPFEFPAGAEVQGQKRFFELGCIACHVPPDMPREQAALGDRLPLHHVAQKWHPAALVEYLQDPRRYHRDVRMPDFRLQREEAIALAAYVHRDAAPPLREIRGDAERGRKLAQKKRCAVCHELDVPLDEHIAPFLRNLDPERGCLAEHERGRGAAPMHELTVEERQALRAFLPFAESVPFRSAPMDHARHNLAAQRCTNCHGLDDRPSTWARVTAELAQSAPLPPEQDPVAQGVPALTWVGGKLQPSWIARFVTGEEKSPRPWLHARMPAFPDRGEAIARGLVREHGYDSRDEPAVAPNAQLSIHGENLVKAGTGFGCVLCHALGEHKAEQVFEREGIELFLARRRLRHEYYSRWLLDPPRIDPDSRMPKFADDRGKTAFTEILGGDAARQFEAIWQFLGSRR
ncbi:MAG: c-type cytochrome [Planctomycetes bacterium]|nr:c-type cytochrome [Planctomycetota bacterium]